MSRHRILHLTETAGPGGTEMLMVRLIEGLGTQYESKVGLIKDGWLAGEMRKQNIPILFFKSRGTYDLNLVRELVTAIRKERIDLIHSHEFLMNTYGMMASVITGVPQLATVHEKNHYPDRWRRRVAYRLVGRNARTMVAVSEDLRRFLTERIGISPSRIRVVPNGVSVGEGPSHEKLAELRASLGLDQHKQVVGTIGRLHPKKGHKYMIEGAMQVLRKCPDVVFFIAGRGRVQAELEAQAQRMGVAPYMRFLGHREDVRELLAACDVFVLPSLSEGMPLALLEAMAAGVPCVATPVGGISEVLEDGKTGLLVRPGDSLGLAGGIVRLLENPTLAKAIGESARQEWANRFSLTSMTRAYQEIYAELIRKRGKAYR